MNKHARAKILEIRELIRMEDIPHPTVIDSIEIHVAVTEILDFIDNEILNEQEEE